MDWDGKGRRREAAFLHVGFLLGREGSRGTDGHRPLVLKRPHLGLSKPSERGPSIQGLLSLKSFILLFLDLIEMSSDFFSFFFCCCCCWALYCGPIKLSILIINSGSGGYYKVTLQMYEG